jgi:GTP1/Obg family GTP-binding protein
MKPKNVKERKSSFIKFLLLFLLTTTTIMVAVFFNFRVPQKENSLLKERAKNMEREMKFQAEFAEEIHGTKAMIDSLDIPGQNVSFMNTLIGQKLGDLQSNIPSKDSTYRYKMYSSIINTLVDLQAAKKELHDLSDAKSLIEEYRAALDKARSDLEQSKRDLDVVRLSQGR